MPYDPMQYAQARAAVFGRTMENVGNDVSNLAQNIEEFVKTKQATKAARVAYSKIMNNYIQEYARNGIPEDEAALRLRRFFMEPSNNPAADMEGWVKNQSFVEKDLQDIKASGIQSKVNEAIQSPEVMGGPNYSAPVDTGKGFTEQTATSETPAPKYQEDAIGSYGKQMAFGRAPYQTSDQLEKHPYISALPKRPKPEDPLEKLKMETEKTQQENMRLDGLIKRKQLAQNPTPIDKGTLHESLDIYHKASDEYTKANSTYAALDKAIKIAQKGGKDSAAQIVALLDGVSYNGPTDLDSLMQAHHNAFENLNSAKNNLKLAKKVVNTAGSSDTSDMGTVWRGAEAKNKQDQIKEVADKIGEYLIEGNRSALDTARSGGTVNVNLDQFENQAIEKTRQWAQENGIDEDTFNAGLSQYRGNGGGVGQLDTAVGANTTDIENAKRVLANSGITTPTQSQIDAVINRYRTR